MQPIAASLLPRPQDQFSQLSQPQLIKTTAELQIIYCMYYTQRHKLEGFPRRISLTRQFFLHPKYSSGNSPNNTGTAFKHPNVFQTLHIFYSILFQDIVTIIQAALVLLSGLTNWYFWWSIPPKFNSELKMTLRHLIIFAMQPNFFACGWIFRWI